MAGNAPDELLLALGCCHCISKELHAESCNGSSPLLK